MLVDRLCLLQGGSGVDENEERDRWEGVREEEERRSRAWEPPGASL